MKTDVAIAAAIGEAQKALRCLYSEVPQLVARDIATKIYPLIHIIDEFRNQPVSAAVAGVPAVEDGYVLVPREPTEDMLHAAMAVSPLEVENGVTGHSYYPLHMYRAMIAAAPPANASPPPQADMPRDATEGVRAIVCLRTGGECIYAKTQRMLGDPRESVGMSCTNEIGQNAAGSTAASAGEADEEDDGLDMTLGLRTSARPAAPDMESKDAVAWRRRFAQDNTGGYETHAFRATPPGDELNWEPLYLSPPAATGSDGQDATDAARKVVGHKTFHTPGRGFYHEPLYADEAATLLQRCEDDKALREALMPDEESAIRLFFDAWLRLKEGFGWRDAIYCPKDRSEFLVIEAGSTGQHRCIYEGEWPQGTWWILSDGDMSPSRPTLFKPIDAAMAQLTARAGYCAEAGSAYIPGATSTGEGECTPAAAPAPAATGKPST